MHDEKTAKALLEQARKILEPIRETTDPRRGWLVALYGSIIEATADNPWQACEAWARRAVSVAPQDWRTWSYLAHAASSRFRASSPAATTSWLTKSTALKKSSACSS